MADGNFVIAKGVDNHYKDKYLDEVMDNNLSL